MYYMYSWVLCVCLWIYCDFNVVIFKSRCEWIVDNDVFVIDVMKFNMCIMISKLYMCVILCVYRLGVCVYVFIVVYNWYCLLMIVDDEWLFVYIVLLFKFKF